jgi:hypothetical protein
VWDSYDFGALFLSVDVFNRDFVVNCEADGKWFCVVRLRRVEEFNGG